MSEGMKTTAHFRAFFSLQNDNRLNRKRLKAVEKREKIIEKRKLKDEKRRQKEIKKIVAGLIKQYVRGAYLCIYEIEEHKVSRYLYHHRCYKGLQDILTDSYFPVTAQLLQEPGRVHDSVCYTCSHKDIEEYLNKVGE